MKFLAAFCLLGFLNCQHISVDVNIEEDGAQYKQIVEFDPESKENILQPFSSSLIYLHYFRLSPSGYPIIIRL